MPVATTAEPTGDRPTNSLAQHGDGLEVGPFIPAEITFIVINAYFVTSLDCRNCLLRNLSRFSHLESVPGSWAPAVATPLSLLSAWGWWG